MQFPHILMLHWTTNLGMLSYHMKALKGSNAVVGLKFKASKWASGALKKVEE
ncbi:hypothetical protein SLEP1_g27848 [Rubroshorea leprosula]|uniref:Uncharacterized protein n=1 Tax=Rubroshorea leprosula TaxID=152421 RepID=A0AAV5K121_9ROSI|nr:hypothetical protein SLEP1_g27848 [Rubroshorea leprosula]